MQNHTTQKPTKLFSIITSILVSLNTLGTAFVGLILYFIIEVSDPPPGDTLSLEVFYRQKHLDQSTIGLVTFIFIIAFIAALIFWLKGKRFGGFVLSGLALLHLAAINFLIAYYLFFVPLVLIGSLVLDIAILAVIFIQRIKQSY